MLNVVNQLAERIVKDSDGFGKRNTVLLKVVRSLAPIPFEGEHGANVVGRVGIRLTPELSCGRVK